MNLLHIICCLDAVYDIPAQKIIDHKKKREREVCEEEDVVYICIDMFNKNKSLLLR